RVMQSAIVIFLVGSVLCGMSRSMTQLVLFRFVQGLGGGGLMVTSIAVVGDLVSPRERGRYQGIFGAVFGVSSIAGPLIGGYLTTNLSWRWIFYVNLPLGVLALVVLAATLPMGEERVRHALDWTGSALLAVALAALTIVTDLGGTAVDWRSPSLLVLLGVAIVATIAFLHVERRAAEPVLPPRLFLDRTFTVTSAVGFCVGFALFGAVTYIPIFLQVVKGESPTASGLQMLPMMGGMLVSSIVSGQLISRWGRFKVFPVAGTALSTLGLFLLARMTPATTVREVAVLLLLLGLGLGMVMQVLVLAVQNAVPYRDLGVATSGTTLFRLIGGSLGTAVLGAILAEGLASGLRGVPGLPPEGATALSPAAVTALPDAVHATYVAVVTSALSSLFAVAAVVSAIGFALSWLLPELPLRQTVAAAAGEVGYEVGETFPMPEPAEPLPQLLRGLAILADRDEQLEHLAAVVRHAGETLQPSSAWLLLHLADHPTRDPAALARAHDLADEELAEGLRELSARALVTPPAGGRADGRWVVTPAGSATTRRLAIARRERLAALLPDVAPDRRDEVLALLGGLAHVDVEVRR
ncbi:MAG TPA: MDR family MFS transporter, partial [Gemmatimonadaceae bacterium]|nr:MDR family MFS transporter [Gemmatimonadaceae bacterium]